MTEASPWSFNDLALQLWISEILIATPHDLGDGDVRLRSHGLYYKRVHIQGTLEAGGPTGFALIDPTGYIPVQLPRIVAVDGHPLPAAEAALREGDLVALIGEVGEVLEGDGDAGHQETRRRFVKAKKAWALRPPPPDAAHQWFLATEELASSVYPQMAAAGVLGH